MKKKLCGAIIGYGGMGKNHAKMMQRHGIEFGAVCDLNPERLAEAAEDYTGIRTFSTVESLLNESDIDLVTVITPHSAHHSLAMQILDSGKHCIVEKPLCLKEKQAEELVYKAKKKSSMLTAYHNRRWDGWYTTFKDLMNQGVLGDIFHVELFHGGYHEPKVENPRMKWRSNKETSGGLFYDWGAHYVDWLLGFMPAKIKSIRGFSQKRLFPEITNEDQIDSVIAFEDGAVAHIQISSIALNPKPHRRILGTRGAVLDNGEGQLTLTTWENGESKVKQVPYDTGIGAHELFYANVVDHLTNGADLIVKPEEAARTVAVIETTGKSAEAGRELTVTI